MRFTLTRRRGLIVILSVLLLTGCVGRVVPPTSLSEPVEIHLIDHGRHASLVLPHHQGGMVRYSYGEWSWYVEGRRHLLAGMMALLWPTRSGLGRGVHDDVSSPREFSRLAPEGLMHVYTLEAESERVEALQRKLDAYFDREEGDPVYVEEFGLEFVPHPRAYWLAHQSNLAVARWLRQLGFEVEGSAWLSNWRIESSR
ncbi:hypothetical protein [Billgrantia endophytica]|uniref:DUF2459 domain-containing protein n=1 Tax=Billgrantia endophytica TaxID=2033802 RepID=A0A2N7TWU2_9GAMM|nr:hypothetical protein [Halomonas endophytica]PMR72652.1 hypothetical protein C1H69_20635 [Halomonas endophytica]